MGRIEGKVAIVTGAAHGMGAATEAAFGPVSVLVNNAGIGASSPLDRYQPGVGVPWHDAVDRLDEARWQWLDHQHIVKSMGWSVRRRRWPIAQPISSMAA